MVNHNMKHDMTKNTLTVFFPPTWQDGYDNARKRDKFMQSRSYHDFELEHEIWDDGETDGFRHVCYATVDLDTLKVVADVAELTEVYLLRAPTRYVTSQSGAAYVSPFWETEAFNAYGTRSYGDLENLSQYDKTPLIERAEYRGTLEHCLVYVPALCSGSDYSGGSVTKANFQVFCDKFKALRGEVWWELYGGHGTYAIAIALDCHDGEIIEFFTSLADYPCADDDELCQVETEAEDESWENWIRSDFTRALKGKFPDLEDAIDDIESDTLRELLATGMERANQYFEHESGGGVFLRLEKVVSSLTVEDLAVESV